MQRSPPPPPHAPSGLQEASASTSKRKTRSRTKKNLAKGKAKEEPKEEEFPESLDTATFLEKVEETDQTLLISALVDQVTKLSTLLETKIHEAKSPLPRTPISSLGPHSSPPTSSDDEFDEGSHGTISSTSSRRKYRKQKQEKKKPDHKEPPVADPHSYDGSQNLLQTFLTSVQLYIALRPNRFKNEKAKILFAISYCNKGRAAIWVQTILKQLDNHQLDWSQFEDFEEAIKERFGDRDIKTTAQNNLEKVRQRGRTVNEYIADFQTWENDTGYNQEYLMTKFQKDLDSSIRNQIFGHQELPRTLGEWFSRALRVEQNIEKGKAPATTASFPRSIPFQKIPAPTPKPSPRFDGPPRIPVSSGKCFLCGKTGHMARNCPDKQVARINGVTWDEIRSTILEEDQEASTYSEEEQGFVKNHE